MSTQQKAVVGQARQNILQFPGVKREVICGQKLHQRQISSMAGKADY